MKKYLNSSDEERKAYYKTVLDAEIDYKEKNDKLRVKFLQRLFELDILEKFDEVREAIESCKANGQMKSNYKRQYFNISNEYNGIINEATEAWHYYRYLFNNIRFNSEESKNGGKDIELNIVNEVLLQIMNAYIKYDKSLIIIIDKLDTLNSLFI